MEATKKISKFEGMRVFPTLTIIGLCIFFSCNWQQEKSISVEKIHSLHKRIDTTKSDSNYERLHTLQKILKKEAKYPDSLRAENAYLLGQFFEVNKELDSAAYYYLLAIDYVTDTLKPKVHGRYFRDAYYAFSDLGLYGNCLTVANRYKDLAESSNFPLQYTWALHLEKGTLEKMGKYDEAFEIAQRILENAKNNDPQSVPYALTGIAKMQYKYFGNKEIAYRILDSMAQNSLLQYESDKATVYGTLGIYDYYKGNYKNALNNYLKACEAQKRDLNSPNRLTELANIYNNIAEVQIDLQEYDKARAYLDSVKRFGFHTLRRSTQKEHLKYELRLSAETYQKIDRVYAIIDSINAYQDTLYNQKLQNELIELTKTNEEKLQVEREKQQTEIQNTRLLNGLIYLGSIVLLLGVLGFLLYQRRKLNFEKQQLLTQQKLLRSQMNPHFAFNTLYAIQNEIKSSPKQASHYLLKFSRLFQLILENSTQNYIQLEKEMEALEQYLQLVLYRFPNQFEYKIKLINIENDDFIFIPPMLIQPFVENAITHGFQGIDYTGKLDLTLEEKEGFLQCTIQDNGKGIQSNKNLVAIRKSSTALISEYLKKQTRKDLQYEPINQGTKVIFWIPFITYNDD